MNKLQKFLDELVIKYEIEDFIKSDPIQFPHRFTEKNDIEISALVASSLAYGKREKIIEANEKILELIEHKPYDFVKNFDFKDDYKIFDNFNYRYNKGTDVALLFHCLKHILLEYGSLENLFMSRYNPQDETIYEALDFFAEEIKKYSKFYFDLKGFNHLLPSPKGGSACKRLNMFLRWIVRKPPVDFGLWQGVSPSKLLIPLDVHVAKISRELKLTNRNANDWKTAFEITQKLKEFDSLDPAKYDFAIFTAGIYKEEM